MFTVILVATALMAVMYTLCWLRILPAKAYIAWFTFVFGVNTIFMNVLTGIIHLTRFIGVPERSRCRGSVVIRIHIDKESWQVWASAPRQSAMALNHTSFLDAFVFVGTSPWGYIYHCRTLMKASLRKIPVFGAVFDRCGHFPVHFVRDHGEAFTIDKARHEQVMKRINHHINEDLGSVAIFPEGSVNKSPGQLLPFRHGSFKIVLDHTPPLPLFTYVTTGNDLSWSATAPIGGLPADVYITVKSLEVRPDEEPKELAKRVQESMQADLDKLHELIKKEKNE